MSADKPEISRFFVPKKENAPVFHAVRREKIDVSPTFQGLDLKVRDGAQWIKETKADIRDVGLDAVIGEQHLRYHVDELEERRVRQRLKAADIIAVEFDSHNPKNGYNELSPYVRYMELAQVYAIQGGKEFVVLNDFLPQDRYDLWRKAGIPLTWNEVVFARLCYSAFAQIVPRQMMGKMDEVSDEELVQNMLEGALVSHGDVGESAKPLAQSALKVAKICITFDSEKFREMIQASARIDSVLRDREYAAVMQQLHRTQPGKSIATVVGSDHVTAIEQGLLGKSISIDVPGEQLENIIAFADIGKSFSQKH